MASYGYKTHVSNLLFRQLDTVGDGTGDFEVTGNYAAAAESFKITTPEGRHHSIHRMIVEVVDGGSFDSGAYGNGIALTNGLTLKVEDPDGETLLDLTGRIPIKTNADWGALCYDADVKTWGAGDEVLLVRWTFAKSGAPLHLPEDHSLVLRANDNFTGLISQTFTVQGIAS